MTSQNPEQTHDNPVSRFGRSLSASAQSYFNKPAGAASSSTPASTPGPISHPHTPGTPVVGDVIGYPTPFQRFLNLGRPRKHVDVQFPPPHWTGDGAGGQASGPLDSPAIVLPDEPASEAELEDPAVLQDPIMAESVDPPPEPRTIAGRIQALLSRAPPPPSSESTAAEGSEEPIHPPPQLISDSKLITLLSSPAVMNGTLSKGGQSVWSVLDRLRAQLPGQGASSSRTAPKADSRVDGLSGPGDDQVLDDDDSGFMVYGPLFPNADSHVELAKSELVEEKAGEKPTAPDGQATSTQERLQELKGKVEGIWPFKGKSDGQEETGPSRSRINLHGGKSKRVWIPSPDQISIQVMWWGYRIYLPPPVLEILDNKQLEGAKRAALLTTALKWALDRIPLVMLPPQARPVVRLLKAFTPYLGYVGGFVAWSWGAVKSFDKGHGVTLTATWLLTIAVIPGSWEEHEFPREVHGSIPKAVPEAGDAKVEGQGQSSAKK